MAYHYLLNHLNGDKRTCRDEMLANYMIAGWKEYPSLEERDAAIPQRKYWVAYDDRTVTQLSLSQTIYWQARDMNGMNFAMADSRGEGEALLAGAVKSYDCDPQTGEITARRSWQGDSPGRFATYDEAYVAQEQFCSYAVNPFNGDLADIFPESLNSYNRNGWIICVTREECARHIPVRWRLSGTRYIRVANGARLSQPSDYARVRAMFAGIETGATRVDRRGRIDVNEQLDAFSARMMQRHGWDARTLCSYMNNRPVAGRGDYTLCGLCRERLVHPSVSYRWHEESYCNSCAQNFRSCAGCGETNQQEDMIERDGDYYCPDCVPDREAQPGELISYSHDVLDYKKGFRLAAGEAKHTKALWLGVELEVHPGNAADNSQQSAVRHIQRTADWAICKDDGSLREDGFEIVTVPGSLSWFQTTVKPWLEANNRWIEGWNHKDCGMHVHVGKEQLSKLTLGKLLVFMHDKENQPFITHIAGRENGSYTNRAQQGKKRIPDYAREKAFGRYQALNFATRGQKTIEFRIFRSNVAVHGFMRNVEFVHALVSWCRDSSMGDVAASQRGLRGSNGTEGHANFCQYVERNPSTYPSLVRWLEAQRYVTGNVVDLAKVPEQHRAKAQASRLIENAA